MGLAAMEFWTRKKFNGCNALKKKINPTRVPIEKKESVRWLENLRQSTALFHDPQRCVHIGDRESDIYELFCTAQEEGTHFLVRTCVDRLAGDGKHTIADEMQETRVKGLHRIDVRDRKGDLSKAILEIKYRRIRVLPPIGTQTVSGTRAHRHSCPRTGDPTRAGEDRLEIDHRHAGELSEETIEKLPWYSMRWKIETFHKILKSGCKAEESRLRTAARLANDRGFLHP